MSHRLRTCGMTSVSVTLARVQTCRQRAAVGCATAASDRAPTGRAEAYTSWRKMTTVAVTPDSTSTAGRV